MSDMAVILLNFQGQYEVIRKLKGPFYKRDDWLKSAENLGASPFKWDLNFGSPLALVRYFQSAVPLTFW
jgi:hypothetical protein